MVEDSLLNGPVTEFLREESSDEVREFTGSDNLSDDARHTWRQADHFSVLTVVCFTVGNISPTFARTNIPCFGGKEMQEDELKDSWKQHYKIIRNRLRKSPELKELHRTLEALGSSQTENRRQKAQLSKLIEASILLGMDAGFEINKKNSIIRLTQEEAATYGRRRPKDQWEDRLKGIPGLG